MYKTSDTPNSASIPSTALVEIETAAGNQEHILGATLNALETDAVATAAAASEAAIAIAKAEAIEEAHPVGSVYISVLSTSPATLFGGTWTAIASGRVLVGRDAGDADFNTAEETGGAKTHTLTTAEMPSHSHSYLVANSRNNTSGDVSTGTVDRWTNDTSGNTGSAGGGGAHNNVQPYFVVYMWKRTA